MADEARITELKEAIKLANGEIRGIQRDVDGR